MLKVQNLHKKYPGEHYGAVVNISFDLKECEVLAVVGRSGSGKSTLLRMLAGLMKPDSGQIIFEGEELKNPEEQLIAGHEKIKMVFQDFQVQANMTVAENIRYKLLHFNKSYQEERSEELMELCGITSFADKMPHELSGGQQQRLSLARALADDPQLLLMDEPFSNLDPIIKEDLLMELTEIVQKENLSLILVSHDTRDALLIADRIAFVERGELIQMDTPEKIYKEPSTLEVAQFFGRVNTFNHNGNPVLVRAEYLKIDYAENELEVEVMVSTFMGTHFLNQARSNTQEMVLFHSSEKMPVNSTMKLGFSDSCKLTF